MLTRERKTSKPLFTYQDVEFDDVVSSRRTRENESAMAYVMTTISQRLEILDIRIGADVFLLVNSHFFPPIVILYENEPILNSKSSYFPGPPFSCHATQKLGN